MKIVNLISAKFTPSPVIEEIETDFNNTVLSVKNEVITEEVEEKMASMESMENHTKAFSENK